MSGILPESPFELSRALAPYCEAVARSARGGPLPHFAEVFPGKTTFIWASDLPEYDPLRRPLLRTIQRLTEIRISIPLLEGEQRLLDAGVAVREPSEQLLSRRQLRLRLLSSRGAERSAWSRSWARQESQLSDHRVRFWEVVREIGERMGVPDVFGFWDPLLPSGQDEITLVGLARALLDGLRDAAENLVEPGWDGLLGAVCGDGAESGWPARLAPDTLRDLYGRRGVFRGVWVDPGVLPERLCPASFLRAASRVGRALSDVLARDDLPRIVARDLDNLLGHKYAALFYLWSLSPSFCKRRLQLSGERFSTFRRQLRKALVSQVRLEATRLILLHEALSPSQRLREHFGEHTSRLLHGEELPPSALLARFGVARDQAARFAGLLWGAAEAQRATMEHDEDWFENPRAGDEMRAELSLPAPVTVESQVLEKGRDSLLLCCLSEL